MRRSVVVGAMALAALLAGSATADAASFAGKWTAQYTKATTLVLTVKAHGSNYAGTYSVITTVVAKNKKKTITASQPFTAKTVTVQKVPTLVVSLTKTKPTVDIFCVLKKTKLSCVSPVTNKTITFNPTR